MYTRKIDNFWSFKTADTKEFTHCYHTYPAMMIPQVARTLIERYKPSDGLSLIMDPYMGSGTTLVESSLIGVNSVGTDINPLARLISSVKTTHFEETSIHEYMEQVSSLSDTYSPEKVTNTNFDRISNYSFWYTEESLLKLSFIDQTISKYPKDIVEFFKLALSETVREVSFTRNGEFKRFKMSAKSLSKFNPDVFKIFENKLKRNYSGLQAFNKVPYRPDVKVCDFNTVEGIPEDIVSKGSVDMVVTSPPYGDSHTTVAYGQFSRWANEWFNFPNAKNLDKILMGGRKLTDISISPRSISNELHEIQKSDSKRYDEVMSFMQEYYLSMKNVASVVRKGGRICYVVGNRTVKGIQIPLDYFTAEVFESFGCKHEITIVREIPNKRMPSKTSPSNVAGDKVNTMSNEYIVIMTKEQ